MFLNQRYKKNHRIDISGEKKDRMSQILTKPLFSRKTKKKKDRLSKVDQEKHIIFLQRENPSTSEQLFIVPPIHEKKGITKIEKNSEEKN